MGYIPHPLFYNQVKMLKLDPTILRCSDSNPKSQQGFLISSDLFSLNPPPPPLLFPLCSLFLNVLPSSPPFQSQSQNLCIRSTLISPFCFQCGLYAYSLETVSVSSGITLLPPNPPSSAKCSHGLEACCFYSTGQEFEMGFSLV